MDASAKTPKLSGLSQGSKGDKVTELQTKLQALKYDVAPTGVFDYETLQAVLGFLFLYWSAGNLALQKFGDGVSNFLALARDGSNFVFGPLAQGDKVRGVFGPNDGFVFAFQVLPTLIFFSSFMAVLYHLGIMQMVVRAMAWVMVRVMGTSGSESLSACANVFVGQTEAPLLIRPFLKDMTMSELHAIMVGGFASVAAEGFQAPGVVVSYTTDADIQNGKKFLAMGVQTAAGVPLMCDEPADFRTFRIGLFGLEKLHNPERSVENFRKALDAIVA